MFDKRYNLGQAAAADPIRLVTETWREYAARRQRCLEIRKKLRNGEVHQINDLITYNLDIRQFAEDVISTCEGPELLRAFYHAIAQVTVLDPTCGSGAFLFAALNILEPLYDACLDRMQVFVEELPSSGGRHHREKFADFKKILARVAEHPNHRYFVLKSIIINNLYGVDIMPEAVEICKLRLFLKLVAQVEDAGNIEPLPDIDFNIRAGNTLVGFANYEEVKKAVGGKLDFDNAMGRIDEKAEECDRAAKMFRLMQTEHDMPAAAFATAKEELRRRLGALADELDRYLAGEYGIHEGNYPKKKELEARFKQWRDSHQPFHWFSEFYGIIKSGGFDVIIGNPPFLELNEVNYRPINFICLDTKTIHAICIERSSAILKERGSMSLILPMSVVSTQRMTILQNIIESKRDAWYSNFAWRPAKLFDTVNRAISFFIVSPAIYPKTFSTNYQKWTSDTRPQLFPLINYVEVPRNRPAFWVPKLGSSIEQSILNKCILVNENIGNLTNRTQHYIYYRTTGGLYWKVFTDFMPAFKVNGKSGQSSRQTWFSVDNKNIVRPIIASLSSDIFWWWYTITSTLRDLNPYDINYYPLPYSIIEDKIMQDLGQRYLIDLQKNSSWLVRQQKQTGRTETQMFKIQKSKPIIEEIDKALAKHYGFTDEELDFIINYDIKYRMGAEAEGEG